MAEHRLSLAVNRRENLLHPKLITYRPVDRAGAGRGNGRQVTAGSVAICRAGGRRAAHRGGELLHGAAHRAVV